ncbi:PREDICTED: limbic system-associated membrane protein-like isoform X2 [Dinoponera quadriceps]|uniref:Limbic system-associated membrane protein-like isoform X2 n=1 Tax=Dinoponera quadriceps TaxID=609295 RepID=A0A6P3X0V5_DINQU|nr:PREDICTED: limbic system-associated membrane protein-like isoform X2 [Dinoponera quadriceps]XP_014471499.1 PREDICTED: limbic system-associated membrane protein-like isoform X2 [Dinoponera quadriceps]
MLPPRILGLLVILLAVQGLCKPTKSTEGEDYEDDPPFDEEDEDDEDVDDADFLGPQPQILSLPTSVRVTEGSTAMLNCNVIHAEKHAVAWMKDKEYLYVDSDSYTSDSKRIIRLPNNTLVIYNATISDSSDNYECIIVRKQNIVLTHRLRVDPKGPQSVAVPPQPIAPQQPVTSQQPATPQQPVAPQQSTVPSEPVGPPQHSHRTLIRVMPKKRIDVNQGLSVTFGCETNMQPPPEIKWFVENKKLNNDPDVVVNNNYITIRKVNKTHSGLYQCLAEDGSSDPAIEAITLVVNYAPEIEAKRSVVHTGTGIESDMTCIVSAYPKAIIKWYKDNKEITQKKGLIILHHGDMKDNRTKHILKILHTTEQDLGEYKCSAQNSIGLNYKSIKLTGTPSQAKPIGAEMTNDDTGIILKWRLESYSPINEYKLQYRRRGDENWSVAEPEVKNGKGNQFIVEQPIKELEPGSYEAILLARNSFGWSPPSEPHLFAGDYPPEMARKEGNSAIQIRPPGILLAFILVVLSCAFTSL